MTLSTRVRSLARMAGKALAQTINPSDHLTYRKFAGYTMISRSRYLQNLWLVRQASGLDGVVVECGVWRGGMIAGIASTIGNGRTYVLFDSFEGLPPAGDQDGQSAKNYQANTSSPKYFNNCAAERAEAERAMARAGIESPEIRQGWFEDTVSLWAEASRPIAVLRLDGDWYESTLVCLTHLFPLVVSGGYIIIDDYGSWEGCTKAVHEYLASHQRREAIRQTLSGVTYMVKD